MKTYPVKQNKDTRGRLLSNSVNPIMESVKHFFVSKSIPGAVRGNHYHKNKHEYFFVIQGKCLIVVEDIEKHEKEELLVEDKDNIIVDMEPNKAHAMKNVGDNELILLALVNEILDQKNPDTYPYQVIKIKNEVS